MITLIITILAIAMITTITIMVLKGYLDLEELMCLFAGRSGAAALPRLCQMHRGQAEIRRSKAARGVV